MNQIRSYAIAARLNTSVPDLMAIGIDTRNLYIRPHFDPIGEWLVISGQDHTTGALPSNGYNPWAELESASRKFFDIKTIDYRWAAQDSMPIDRVPFIGKMPRTKNFYVTTGFGEWGMTPGIISGKIISDLILGIENKWAELYSPSRVKPFSSIKSTISLISHVTKRLGSKIVPFEHFSREKLNPEQGSVFNVQGEKTAVYKDSDGLLKAHSASCTHLKCIVKWNPVEKTWDCPCHGSRFDTDGQVLNSPSISPLKVKDVSNI
jgi:Rieske Fe-S protein